MQYHFSVTFCIYIRRIVHQYKYVYSFTFDVLGVAGGISITGECEACGALKASHAGAACRTITQVDHALSQDLSESLITRPKALAFPGGDVRSGLPGARRDASSPLLARSVLTCMRHQ